MELQYPMLQYFTRETEQGSANSWKEGSAYSWNKWGEIVPYKLDVFLLLQTGVP